MLRRSFAMGENFSAMLRSYFSKLFCGPTTLLRVSAMSFYRSAISVWGWAILVGGSAMLLHGWAALFESPAMLRRFFAERRNGGTRAEGDFPENRSRLTQNGLQCGGDGEERGEFWSSDCADFRRFSRSPPASICEIRRQLDGGGNFELSGAPVRC